ncbi:Smr/MutS family protein [Aquincola sp. MAHUQ-54]|uniref:Smr/MutS family protein n=1 Tax=Aquincola agrisoli TaxID=3119538 RepID=A0AAW9Q8H0_9BURK
MKLNDLKALGPVKEALARAAREAAERRAEAARQERERHLFQRSVGEVTPLRDGGRVVLARPRPAPLPRQRELDEAAALRQALSDEFDVESLLETDEGLSFRRRHVGADVPRRLRRGQWAIQSQIDLHGLRRDEAREQLGAFLHEAQAAGHRCIRVVHGKGLGSPGRTPVLKGKVRAWLVQNQLVQAFVQARASEGGHGALVVLLAPRTQET